MQQQDPARLPSDLPPKPALAVLAAVLAAGAWIRFHGLFGVGLWVADAATYTDWIFVYRSRLFSGLALNPFGKPGLHLLAWALAGIVGWGDHTLPCLTAIHGLANMALVYAVGVRLHMRRVFALLAAVLFGFIPYMVQTDTCGLPHTPSTTYTLLSFLLLLEYLRRPKHRFGFLFASGVCAAIAPTIHPSLLALFPGIGLAAGLSCLRTSLKPANFGRAIGHGVLFFAGCVTAWVFMAEVIGLHFSRSHFVHYLHQFFHRWFVHRAEALQGLEGSFGTKMGYIMTHWHDLLSWPVLLITAALLLFALVRLVQTVLKARRAGRDLLPDDTAKLNARGLALVWGLTAWLIIVLCAGCRAWVTRVLIPVVPITLLAVCYAGDLASRSFRARTGIGVLALAGILAVVQLALDPDLVRKQPTAFREIGNVLGAKVDCYNRVLTSPTTFGHNYMFTSYVDGMNVYHVKRPWTPEVASLRSYQIRYIVVGRQWPKGVEKRLKALTKGDRREYELMEQGLRGLGAKALYESENVAIYEMPESVIPRAAPGAAPGNYLKPTPDGCPFTWASRYHIPVGMGEWRRKPYAVPLERFPTTRIAAMSPPAPRAPAPRR